MPTDIRRLVDVARRVAPRRVLAQVLLLLAVGIVGGANLLMLIPIVNSLADGQTHVIAVPELGRIDLGDTPLWVLLGGVVFLTALQALIQRTSAVNAAELNESVAAHARTEAFDAILAAEWAFVLDRRRSDVVAAVANGASRAGQALSEILSGSVMAVTAVVTALVALIVEPALAGIAIIGTLVLGALLSTSIRPAFRMGGLYTDRYRALHSVMTDSLDSLRLIRAHDAADMWRRELVAAFAGTREVQVAYVRQAATLSAASQVGLVASASFLVLAAVWLDVPPPSIVVVLLLIARLARSIQSLASTSQRLANHLPGVREIDELTDAARAAAEHPVGLDESSLAGIGPAPAVEAPANASHGAPDESSWSDDEPLPGTGFDPLVSLRNVTFRYAAGAGGVFDLSFDIPSGKMIALTGASGSGKSTTADIVLGLLRPQSGEVLIDGRPLTRSGLRAWRARVAYVPQETVLIPRSLRHNLLWSVGQVDDATCWQALDRAAAAFAHQLPDGLDTELGDRGIRLSGGERQRVAIARALLRKPDVLVLDEATSSLDDASEAAVLGLLASLTPAVTILVIAHRRSTVDAADHIVQLAGGQRIESTVSR